MPGLKEFDWGWTTETFGYGEVKEPPKEEPKLEEKKQTLVGGFLSKIKGTPAKETVTPAPAAAKVETPPAASATPSKDNNFGHPEDERMWACPPDSFRNDHKRLKDWYRLNSVDGKCDPKWKDLVAIRTKHKREVKVDTAPPPKSDTAPGAYRSFEDAGEAIRQKDTTTKHIPAAPAPAGSPLKVAIRDVSSRAITDPLKWAEAEAKVPNVAEREGFNFEDTFRWSIDDLKMLAKDHPDFTAELLHNMRQRYMLSLSASKTDTKLANGKKPDAGFVGKKVAGLPM